MFLLLYIHAFSVNQGDACPRDSDLHLRVWNGSSSLVLLDDLHNIMQVR